MSSSVFMERNISVPSCKESGAKESNLVVVYGKNGINFDRQSLENLIEKKTLASISVIRLTSPYIQDMENGVDDDELIPEKGFTRYSREREKESDSISDSEVRSDSENIYKQDNINDSSEEHDSCLDDSFDEQINKDVTVEKTNIRNINKIGKQRKARAEVVGLALENFYSSEEANEVAEEILKMAGISTVKYIEDYKFKLYVIQNDHCYTPYTSPNQMKTILASDKIKDVQQTIADVKQVDPTVKGSGRPEYINYNVKCLHEQSKIYLSSSRGVTDEVRDDLMENCFEQSSQKDDDESFYSVSEESDESANDRDSDLDFDVTNRKGAKSKRKTKKMRSRGNRLLNKRKYNQGENVGSNESDFVRTLKQSLNLSGTKSDTVHVQPSNYMPQRILHIDECKNTMLNTHTTFTKTANVAKYVPASQKSKMPRLTSPSINKSAANKVIAVSGSGLTDISSFPIHNSTSVSTPETHLPVSFIMSSEHFSADLPPLHETESNFNLSYAMSTETNQKSVLSAENKQIYEIKLTEDKHLNEKILEQNSSEAIKISDIVNKSTISKPVKSIDFINTQTRKNPVDKPVELIQDIVEFIGEYENLQASEQSSLVTNYNSALQTSIKSTASSDYMTNPNLSKNLQQNINLLNTPLEVGTISPTHPLTVQSNTTRSANLLVGKTKSQRNEPIQIIRGNGRVITLPPMEAPTTRAKRRAQTHCSASDFIEKDQNIILTSNIKIIPMADTISSSINESPISLDNVVDPLEPIKKNITKMSYISNSVSNKTIKIKSSGAASNIIGEGDNTAESQEDDDDPNKLWCICRQPHNNRFMICCDICEDWFHGTCVSVTKAMGIEMEQKGIDWKCPICLEKHFVKTQPKITDVVRSIKSQPQLISTRNVVLESKKLETKIELKSPEQLKRSAFISEQATTNDSNVKFDKYQKSSDQQLTNRLKSDKQMTPMKIISSELNKICIVCHKKTPRVNSIYCSDDCIRKYVATTVNAIVSQPKEKVVGSSQEKIFAEEKYKKKNFEELLSMADKQKKIERIHMFERKSGRIIVGMNAPTTLNLKKWIQENQEFEVVQPGSEQALEIEKRQKLHKSQQSSDTLIKAKATDIITPTTQSKLLTYQAEPHLLQKSILHHLQAKTLPSKGVVHSNPKELDEHMHKASSKPLTSKSIKSTLKGESKVLTQQKKHEEETSSKKHHDKNHPKDNDGHRDCSQPIRYNVRRTLKEQLLLRMKEAKINYMNENKSDKTIVLPKNILTIDEIESFVTEMETEMYKFFNSDTSAKYKAKYRSLMFNIKDRKNQTLFAKICAKLVSPKELVRMSPEELASQELAQWRENETKHQLEIIKKSELDLLSCAKSYLLKTHKGEEVIEGKSTDLTNLDVTPVSGGSVLNALNTTTSQSSDNIIHKLQKEYAVEAPNTNDQYANNIASMQKEHQIDRKKLHKTRNLDISRPNKHDVSSSKTNRSEMSYKKNYGSRDSERKDLSKSNSKEKRNQKTSNVLPTESSENDTYRAKETKIENYSLIDQILESTKTVEEAANIVPDKDSYKKDSKEIKMASKVYSIQAKEDVLKEEDVFISVKNYTGYPDERHNKNIFESLKSISNSSIWTGNINMIDVASFKITLHSIVGNSENLDKLFPKELDVVGRIGAETVWDYLFKIKKSPNKDIVIIYLAPAMVSEASAYDILYEYLDKRKRLGVVKTATPQIKDFYIYPLGAGKEMPSVLKSSDESDFFINPNRENVMIGIIIRVIAKRTQPNVIGTSLKLGRSNTDDVDIYNQLGCPSRKKRLVSNSSFDIDAIIKAPIAAKIQSVETVRMPSLSNDAEQPYSPGESSEDDLMVLKSCSTKLCDANEKQPNEDVLKLKMEELNRQIAVQEMEIADLLNVEPSRFGPASNSNTNVLANISIPSNLSQILASIKNKPEQDTFDVHAMNKNNLKFQLVGYESKSIPQESSSRLAQLSEAELLRMVPDHIDIQSPCEDLQPPGV